METIKLENGNMLVTGTLSHGTLRPQDLIPVFLAALRIVAPDHYEGLVAAAFAKPPAHVQEDDSHAWWDSEDCSCFLNETLLNTLEEFAPEGYYFGTHPGDGSDFGFWPTEEREEEIVMENTRRALFAAKLDSLYTNSKEYVTVQEFWRATVPEMLVRVSRRAIVHHREGTRVTYNVDSVFEVGRQLSWSCDAYEVTAEEAIKRLAVRWV